MINNDARVWAVKLYPPGSSAELVYVVAPDELDAERLAWAKLETITGKTYSGTRWALVSLVRGIRDGTT